ncbi:ribosome biogenesis GTPase Der [Buchnera aphidicola (Melanaphis sacchari)]|uniref:GTPase Der n=1 Tax=Buchnera aphidicola (Melanaphis sacchari) TaxID=2173854 RepID=A0A2U8DED7_9GAMM|nr:ribosome biogenesis GTPase Der [Buchnera aphidicola]AWH90226.1 ribosome biogenesis GTPase Der [Buchnera aphidicola (Melanaphis sacchari)]
MLPIIALIGRTNVGKSTLFNVLTQKRNALVNNQPNLTRDRNYSSFYLKKNKITIIDTAGFDFELEKIKKETYKQTLIAIKECDLILFLVSARDGVMAQEYEISKEIRKYEKKIILIINKIDGVKDISKINEFYSLGFIENAKISASNNQGINTLIKKYLTPWIQSKFDPKKLKKNSQIHPKIPKKIIKISCIGKPNVGKSTLINSILKQERLITSHIPGTTLDSIPISIDHNKKNYTFIDTAGISKKRHSKNKIEKISIIKTLKNIEKTNISLLIIDATLKISNQDLTLANIIEKCGKPVIIVINKWDLINKLEKKILKKLIRKQLENHIFSEIHFISALHKIGLSKIFKSINKIFQKSQKKIATSLLVKTMYSAIQRHRPPIIHGRRIKLKYAHLGSSNPFKIIVHGNQVKYLSLSYKKYLKKYFYNALNMNGIPIQIEFKETKNPYIFKKNN